MQSARGFVTILGILLLGYLAALVATPGTDFLRDSSGRPAASRPHHKIARDYAPPGSTVARAVPGEFQGSAQSMREFALALRTCSILQASDEEAIVQKQAWIAEQNFRFAQSAGIGHERSRFQEDAAEAIEAQLRLKQRCSRIPVADTGKWLSWLERAAESGDLNAQTEYANVIYQKAGDGKALLENIDEVAKQKTKAFRFLANVVASGNCAVSNQMETLAPSALDAYTYALVQFEWGVRMQAVNRTSIELAAENTAFSQRRLELRAAKVTLKQSSLAKARAALISARCRY